ncbi:MAG: hypothetical protein KF729_25860, partial [Sandaracinaceae bacterium]|nr:hypothetical protein [Sandaracinaceae bacterium]
MAESDEQGRNETKTLDEESIVTERVGRRSAVAAIGGTLLGGLALAIAAPAEEAQAQTDSDGGPNADAAGRGRTGITDSDGGRNADRAG